MQTTGAAGSAKLGPTTFFEEPSVQLVLVCGQPTCRTVSCRVIFGVPIEDAAEFAAASAQLFRDARVDGWAVEPEARCPLHRARQEEGSGEQQPG